MKSAIAARDRLLPAVVEQPPRRPDDGLVNHHAVAISPCPDPVRGRPVCSRN